MPDQIVDQTINPDSSSATFGLITIDQTDDETLVLENDAWDDDANETTIAMDATSGAYALITINRTSNTTVLLEKPTWNYGFVGQIIFNVYGKVNRRTGFTIISSTLNPMTWHDTTLGVTNPHNYYTRTDALPVIWHSGLPFSTTNREVSVAVEKPTNNDDANENSKTIGSSNSTANITVDKTDDETATVTTSYDYTVA